jgi:hypothetical protein
MPSPEPIAIDTSPLLALIAGFDDAIARMIDRRIRFSDTVI